MNEVIFLSNGVYSEDGVTIIRYKEGDIGNVSDRRLESLIDLGAVELADEKPAKPAKPAKPDKQEKEIKPSEDKESEKKILNLENREVKSNK